MDNINITNEDVLQAIKESPMNAAAGPDGIPSSLLKNCACELVSPLVIYFRKSLDEGVLPTSCKTAAVIPIHKGGDKSMPANYRPVSLTSVIVKVF